MADEEEAIRYYFSRNYDYATILNFLERFNNIKMSRETLMNRLKQYGLCRRGRHVDEGVVREYIRRELDGSGSLLGYRSMWRRLHSKHGINVPRSVVQNILRELDPEGTELRKARRLKRREYSNPGPNYCWHSDGYDKLKPYGFPIHACIDGFSRRVLWLRVTRSNNDPRVIGSFFVDCIREYEGFPTLLRTDRGTENGIMANIQCYLRRNHRDGLAGLNVHRNGSSPSNQRIEGWWAFLRRSWSTWWMNFFKDIVENGQLDTSNKLHMEILRFCFGKVIKIELDEVKDNWNSHYIRDSRFQTPHGTPDKLYFLPHTVGKEDNKHVFDISDLQEAENDLSADAIPPDDYNGYVNYITEILEISRPDNWRDGLTTYTRLTTIAV